MTARCHCHGAGGLATRYARRAAYWRSELILAAAILWLREPRQDTP